MNNYREEKSKREEWVSNLQVGDEVAYLHSGWGSSWEIYKVEKVTPSGRRNLNYGMVVNSDGTIRGKSFEVIHPVTDKIRASVWRQMAKRKLRNELKIEDLSDNNLNRLLAILKEHKEEIK